MRADVEFIVLPYDSLDSRSILGILIRELKRGDWTHFRAAIAFARTSGNFPELLDALAGFADRGEVRLTFGANTFLGGQGSDIDAVRGVLASLDGKPNTAVHLYHEDSRTFHPKLYIFSNENEALVIIGSSNWTEGGLFSNVEASILVRLRLDDDEQREGFRKLVSYFETFWEEVP